MSRSSLRQSGMLGRQKRARRRANECEREVGTAFLNCRGHLEGLRVAGSTRPTFKLIYDFCCLYPSSLARQYKGSKQVQLHGHGYGLPQILCQPRTLRNAE